MNIEEKNSNVLKMEGKVTTNGRAFINFHSLIRIYTEWEKNVLYVSSDNNHCEALPSFQIKYNNIKKVILY